MGKSLWEYFLPALASVTLGCSLFVDLSGFNEDSLPSTTSEGGTVSEAGGGEAGDGAGAAEGGGFCAQHAGAAFCADFDGNASIADLSPSIDPGATITIDATRAMSPAKSLHAVLDAATGGIVSGILRKRIELPTRRPFRLELDMFFSAPSSWPEGDGNVSLFEVRQTGSTGSVVHELFLNPTQPAVTTIFNGTPNGFVYTGSTKDFPRDAWFHVRFEGDLSDGVNGYVRMWLDRSATPSLERTGIAFESGTPQRLSFSIGLTRYDNGPTPRLEMFYDNVVLDLL